MTENEALDRLNQIKGRISWNDYKKDCLAIDTAIKALEKQIPKKPTIDEFDYGDGYVCGECESFLHYVSDDDEYIRFNYCCNCGQKIDWQ